MADVSHERKVVRYAFIDGLLTNPPLEFIPLNFTIEEYCYHLKVSRSGFYKWRSLQRSKASSDSPSADEVVMNMVHKFLKFTPRNVPGYRTIWKYLRNNNISISIDRLRRLLRANGIRGTQKRRFIATTDSSQTTQPFPNHLKRAFTPGSINQAWCGDITYIRTDEGWLYVASVLEIGSRRLLGVALAPTMEASLVVAALEKACQAAKPKPGCIFHSDQGAQYNSRQFRECLSRHQMIGSMSERGVCWDNATAESFWSILKREINGKAGFSTRKEAQLAILQWINFYNNKRPHGALDNMSPYDYEKSLARTKAERQKVEERTLKVASFI